jgi:hypothetical protein
VQKTLKNCSKVPFFDTKTRVFDHFLHRFEAWPAAGGPDRGVS